MPNQMEKEIISPRNEELLQSMTEEIVERMCIMSEGGEKITHEVLVKSMLRALKNHGVKSNTEDYIIELLPLVDEAIKKFGQAQPEKEKKKKGFSGLFNVFPKDEADPNKVTIESLGIEVSFRLKRDPEGKQKLLEVSRLKPGSRTAGPDSLRFPNEIYKSLVRTAWAILKDRQKK
jgi:hypothetical protein